MTPAQCREARAIVGISQDDLAKATGVVKATVAAFELGQRQPYQRTLRAMRTALEAAGVEFFVEQGRRAVVRLRKAERLTDFGALHPETAHGSQSVSREVGDTRERPQLHRRYGTF